MGFGIPDIVSPLMVLLSTPLKAYKDSANLEGYRQKTEGSKTSERKT
jgi:hypothetical protein